MDITRDNCEAVFLDYYEKHLSPVEVAEVLFFLEENPDKKDLFEAYGAIFLPQEKVDFQGKELLKKKQTEEETETVLSAEINKINCERFFIAYAEGILPDTHTAQLRTFLTQHPEFRKDFELFQKCKLSAENISLEDKQLLKQGSPTFQNLEKYFIRAIEGDLSKAEHTQLSSFLQKNLFYKKEFDLFKKTILVPEEIVCEFKAQLKKKEKKPVFISIFFQQKGVYYAAAASVLLLAGLFFFFRQEDDHASFLAGNIVHSTRSITNINSGENNNKPVSVVPHGPSSLPVRSQPSPPVFTALAHSSSSTPGIKEEKNISPPVWTESKTNDTLLAKQEDDNKPEEKENTLVLENTETKTDSVVPATVQGETVASAAGSQKSATEYQTVASFANKKIRSILGIKKSTPCETSDKIRLWDLAMAAKNGLQKLTGTKAVDVNKVCDGANEKVEYVFAAGNFEISKSVSR